MKSGFATWTLLFCTLASAQQYKLQYSNEFLAGTAPVSGNDYKGVISLPNGQFLVWGNKTVPPSNDSRGILLWFSRTGSLVRIYEDSLYPFYKVVIDSQGNAVVLSHWVSPPTLTRVLKVGIDGVLQWTRLAFGSSQHFPSDIAVGPADVITYIARLHTGTNNFLYAGKIAPDNQSHSAASTSTAISINNPLLTLTPAGYGFAVAEGNGTTAGQVARFGISSSLSFASTGMSNMGWDTFLPKAMIFDTTANLPVMVGRGRSASNLPSSPSIGSFTWSGNFISARSIDSPNTLTRVIKTTSGRLHAFGVSDLFDNPRHLLVARMNINSGGTISAPQWVYTLQDQSGTVIYGGDMAVDAFEESYLAGPISNASGSNSILLGKVNSAGGLRWKTLVPFPDGVGFVHGIALHHSSGDICLVGQGNSATNKEGIIAIFRQAPVAIADAYLNVKRNTNYVSPRTVTNNDRQWQGASITVTQAVSTGTLTMQQNGVFTYTPPSNFTGNATFKYRLSKTGLSNSAEALVTLKVVP